MSAEPDKCPVCGDELDFYGCLGEVRGRHEPIIRAQLEADLKAAVALADAHGRQVEQLEAQLNRLRGQGAALAKTWQEDAQPGTHAHPLAKGALLQCAEELLALVKP